MKPNFLIIGAARSGTTSLYLYMDQHPEIYFSDVKELNFFSNPRWWSKGFEWYESRFRPSDSRVTCIGEASTSYTRAPFSEETPKRIHAYNRDMKLIYMVRNPVDRFISHYLHRVQVGQETRSLDEVIENIKNEPPAWQSCYHYQLEQYLRFFERNQILVLSIEDLKSQPEELMRQIFSFLGVDEDFRVREPQKVFNANRVTTQKSRFGLSVMKFYKRNIEQTRLPYRAKLTIKKLAEIGSTEVKKPELDRKAMTKLKNFYAEDASRLQEDYKIKTDHWFS